MLRVCSICNDLSKIKNIIEACLFPNEVEIDYDEDINYNEWKQTDKAELIKKTCLTAEYIEEVISKFNSLIPHYNIAKQQSAFLKKRKSELKQDTPLVLLDFSENYAFVIQEEIQGNYSSRNTCTIHPVVIYIIENERLCSKTLCFLSDDLKHDVAAVQVFIKHFIEYIKSHFPHVKNVEYYSDGCAGQYKNCTNFLYVCQHKNLYGLNAQWIFFASSHGKSPCDGVGGALKREAAKESLITQSDEQIICAEDLYQFRKSRETGGESNIIPFFSFKRRNRRISHNYEN